MLRPPATYMCSADTCWREELHAGARFRFLAPVSFLPLYNFSSNTLLPFPIGPCRDISASSAVAVRGPRVVFGTWHASNVFRPQHI